jgi:hypothetical protein
LWDTRTHLSKIILGGLPYKGCTYNNIAYLLSSLILRSLVFTLPKVYNMFDTIFTQILSFQISSWQVSSKTKNNKEMKSCTQSMSEGCSMVGPNSQHCTHTCNTHNFLQKPKIEITRPTGNQSKGSFKLSSLLNNLD